MFNWPDMHDDELINSILNGERLGFKQLMEKYQPNVFRIAVGFVHNRDDADEIVQDVFVKVYQSLSTFNGKSAFTTWLYRIAVNTSINYLRRQKRTTFWTNITELLHIASKEKAAETKLVEKSNAEIIRAAINALPEKQQMAFVLLKYEDLSQKEVAAIMHISEGAVEQLVHRARNNLKKNLENKLEEA